MWPRSLVLLAPLALAALACKGGKRDASIEEVVSEGVRIQLGVKPKRVRCERERCELELPGGIAIEARLAGEKEVSWESDLVVKTVPLAVYVRSELAALGVEAEVDCGPPLVAASDATRVTCTLTPRGLAWVEVRADGGMALELAIDEETVRARTEEVDPEGLDELSRALDTDEAEGVNSEESGEQDAGVEPDAQ